MKAAVIEKPGELLVREVPEPVCGPYQALVRIEACSICNGTDWKLIRGEFPGMDEQSYPAVLGHESVGTVIEIGSRVKNYRVGDRVLRCRTMYDPAVLNVCWGGFAQYGLVTDDEAFFADNPGQFHGDWSAPAQQIVPQEMEAANATILVTLKEVLSWLRKFEVGPDTSVLVFGSGPVGLAFCEVAKLIGSPLVAMAGRNDKALSRGSEFGVDAVINISSDDVPKKARELTGGKGFDRAIDAAGAWSLLEYAPSVLAFGGRFGLYGIENAGPGQEVRSIDVPSGWEWSLWQIGACEQAAHEEALEMISSGRLKPDHYITHTIALDGIMNGFELVRRREALKVVVCMNHAQ